MDFSNFSCSIISDRGTAPSGFTRVTLSFSEYQYNHNILSTMYVSKPDVACEIFC